MSLRDTFLNLLGADVQTNDIETQKTSNQFLRSSRDFLKYGNREQLTPEWAEIRMSDKDMYRGYSYAVIQKRGNKVASLAKNNLSTWAKPEVIDKFQANEETVQHPYLKLIEDSTKFTEKQFWKNISIYLDLAGRYYLGAVRNQIQPLKEGFPVINTDITEFVMLNPYEIRRVINKDGVLAGYIERKKDGRYREWPVHQIIEMKELNPFDPDNSQWAITDAAKEAVYTLNQSGDYTRQSLSGNIDAPGIITTDLILNDEDFANFRSRVQQHKKGEPLFGNGAGSIKWDSMQIDLDKAALLDINEINRTMLFAVSGTSKTSLGIEQSGTTRETARVQSEQFVSDTAQPRLEDIVDFLNLDYRRYYKREHKHTGYMIEVNSAVSRDYSVEVQATEMRQAQIDLAMRLMQSGYTMESSYQYAQGEIELDDLELEKGKTKPTPPDDMGGQDGGPDTPETPNDPQIPQVEKTEESTTPSVDLDPNSELTPNADIQENSGEGEQSDPLEVLEVECNHEGECSCCGHDPKIDTYVNRLTTEDNEVLLKAYNNLLKDIREIQKEAINDAIDKVEINSFQESDIITEEQKETLIEKLTNAFKKYWWLLMPLFGNNLTKQRNKEFGEDEKFTFTNELQNKVQLNASEVAKGHTETILRDILDSSNRAYTNVLESAAADLIVAEYKKNPSKFESYFKQQPTVAQATKAIQNTDILETNRKIYEKANKMALDGFKRTDIVKAIREEYNHLSTTRAETIARNETSRAFTQSQYQADYQFLKSINKLDKAYKQLYSRSGNPCKYCQSLINKGPIPFTANFLDKGEEISIVENGKTSTFKADYENITAGVVHVNCQCEYRLVFKGEDGRITDVYNSLRGEDNSNLLNDYSSWLLVHSNDSESRKELNGGKGSGNFGHSGRLGKRGGSGKGDSSDGVDIKEGQETKEIPANFTKDSTKEELTNKTMELVNQFRLKREKILDGAKTPEDIREGLADKNSIEATKEQLEKIDKLDKETTQKISELKSEYYKAKGNYTEPGYYKDAQGNVYEVVADWGQPDMYSPEYQRMYPVNASKTMLNEVFISGQKLEKASESDVLKSIQEGDTRGGISKQDERVIKTYTYATPQNSDLRKGVNISEIPSAKALQGIINRTKSETGTFYRGFQTQEGAQDLLKLKVGDTYSDKGFMSTDRTPEVAKNFATSNVMMKITNKGDSFGKNLSISSYSLHPEENEVLFNAGTKMKVKNITKEGEFTIYEMEVK